MNKSLAYIGVIALVAGVLLTTCVGSAWTMELLTDEEMAVVRGAVCGLMECVSVTAGTRADRCHSEICSPSTQQQCTGPYVEGKDRWKILEGASYKVCVPQEEQGSCSLPPMDQRICAVQWYGVMYNCTEYDCNVIDGRICTGSK